MSNTSTSDFFFYIQISDSDFPNFLSSQILKMCYLLRKTFLPDKGTTLQSFSNIGAASKQWY